MTIDLFGGVPGHMAQKGYVPLYLIKAPCRFGTVSDRTGSGPAQDRLLIWSISGHFLTQKGVKKGVPF